jgi:signal transduction histidine kinase
MTKDAEQSKLLEVINRNAIRLQRLTEDILDVTKIESRSLNLKNEVITNAIDDIMTKKVFSSSSSIITKNPSIKLLNSPPQDVYVYADKGRIGQVVSNLLDNAVKFTTAEGNITIMIKKEAAIRIVVLALKIPADIKQNVIARTKNTMRKLLPLHLPIPHIYSNPGFDVYICNITSGQ